MTKGAEEMDKLADKVMGCIVGATIGDAIGAVFEFRPKDFVRKYLGATTGLITCMSSSRWAHIQWACGGRTLLAEQAPMTRG